MIIAYRVIRISLKVMLAGLLILLAFLFFQFNIKKASQVELGPVTVTRVDGTFKLVIDKREKGLLKFVADKLNRFIYQKAEEHNPVGDLLPDQIDDTVKGQIRERIH